MENDPDAHARAGKSARRTSANNPQVSPGQQRTMSGEPDQQKINMKTRFFASRCAACLCALAVTLSGRTASAIDDQQFNELKELVTKLGQKIDSQDQRINQLEKTHNQDTELHSQDQKTHEQDGQKIQELERKLGETQRTVADVQQRAAANVPAEPLPRVPLDEATVNHNFSILGDAEFQYAKTSGQHGTFLFADFAPIFLYRGGDKVLFEAGFDFGLQNNAPGSPGASTSINLSFAQLDYLINDYVTLAVGDLLLPLGTYSERTAGWLNKIPGDPLPRDLLPGAGVGAQLRGAVPIGPSGKLLNYAVWGVNGPSSADGTGNAGALDLGGNVGLRSDNAVANLHGHPSGGARLGWFMPFKPHYDVELGLSGQSGEWDDAGQHLWSALVADASVHLGSSIELKGEYVRSQYGSDDFGMVQPEGWWILGGYKIAGLNLDWPLINNLELVSRFDRIYDGLGTRTRRVSLGYVYYFSNTLLFEGDYEFVRSTDPAQRNQLVFQLSYGF
jgi:TolA-binding protein